MNLKMRISFRNLVYTILGIVFLGAGVAFTTKAGLGTNALDVLDEIIANKTGISFGRITFIAQILMIVFTLIFNYKYIGIGTLMSMFLTQFPLDFVYSLLSRSNSFVINLLMVVFGTIITGFGAALIIHGKLGMGTYEALTFSIASRLNCKFTYVKYALDSVFLILVIIFKRKIGIGTLIAYLFLGKFIEIFNDLLVKFLPY